MPHYEFFCHTCKKTFTKILTLVDYEEGGVVCAHCGSHDVEQRWSAITAKRASISHSSHYQAERQASEDALASLRVLKRDRQDSQTGKKNSSRGVVCAKQATWPQWKGAFIEKLW